MAPPRADFLRPSKGVCGLRFLWLPYREGKMRFRTLSPSRRERCDGQSFTLAAVEFCVSLSVPFFSPPVSDSTECLLSFLLRLETGHPSSPSASTPVRCPELPLAPFPRGVACDVVGMCFRGSVSPGHT